MDARSLNSIKSDSPCLARMHSSAQRRKLALPGLLDKRAVGHGADSLFASNFRSHDESSQIKPPVESWKQMGRQRKWNDAARTRIGLHRANQPTSEPNQAACVQSHSPCTTHSNASTVWLHCNTPKARTNESNIEFGPRLFDQISWIKVPENLAIRTVRRS